MSSEKKERSFVIDAIILCVITLVLGGILAGVYTMTKGTIAQRQADTDSKACEKVIASVDGATVADAGDDAVAQANDFLTKHILNSSKEVRIVFQICQCDNGEETSGKWFGCRICVHCRCEKRLRRKHFLCTWCVQRYGDRYRDYEPVRDCRTWCKL